ncbi:hypothetical protein [Microvirga mediterraneensis]|uniref:Uncharacterized protein n=1 Tax=Microvirga mediterraneensis TaxID=2754695 RepID=A0A838BNA5_9HYPH|nr:hypothetical protein [Microvirga mediterraneensis]MBA1156928.1 hypothetical protein [Microvirga mediterraneensis]
MAKITYQGEAESIQWFGVTFPKGKAVETDNEALIAKAQRNPFFKTAALVDKKTKAEIEAENRAREEAEEQRQREEEEEARRTLELNGGFGGGDDGSEPEGGEEAETSSRTRSRRS